MTGISFDAHSFAIPIPVFLGYHRLVGDSSAVLVVTAEYGSACTKGNEHSSDHSISEVLKLHMSCNIYNEYTVIAIGVRFFLLCFFGITFAANSKRGLLVAQRLCCIQQEW